MRTGQRLDEICPAAAGDVAGLTGDCRAGSGTLGHAGQERERAGFTLPSLCRNALACN